VDRPILPVRVRLEREYWNEDPLKAWQRPADFMACAAYRAAVISPVVVASLALSVSSDEEAVGGRGRAGLTSRRSCVKACKTTQGILTLHERQSWPRALVLDRPERSDKAEVS
jgi:hypothetical protein